MTKKYIVTGGPGSGKTSILLALEQRGEAIIREAAEDYIRYKKASRVEEPWKEEDFQDGILELQLRREETAGKIEKKGRVFLDRGVLDGLAYYQAAGKEPSAKMRETLEQLKQKHDYQTVFLVENQGSCERNSYRKESLDEALKLELLQEENYTEKGYRVVRIPHGKLEDRMRMVLEHL